MEDKTRMRKIIVTIIIVALVVGYGILPIDAIPDALLGLGQLDDGGVLVLGIVGELINLFTGNRKVEDNGEGSFKEMDE